MSHPRRFFVDIEPPIEFDSAIELSLEDSHHLVNVLRAEIGQQVIVVNRQNDTSYKAILINKDKPIRVKIIALEKVNSASGRVTTLMFPLCKGKKNDLVCEKATELGVRQIIFFQAERSVVRLQTEKEQSQRLNRWETIAKTAAAQSCKNYCPQISLHESLATAIDNDIKTKPGQPRLLCASLSPKSRLLRDIVSPRTELVLLVGPEGDLTKEEVSLSIETGFELISLGPFVLRAETAAIAGVAMIEGLWGVNQCDVTPKKD